MKQDIKKLQKEARQQLKDIKDQQAVIDSVIASLKVEEKLPVKKSTTKKTNNTKQQSNEWDVKIGDEIEFFDPELSYEVTGYRPITEEEGLDFDPAPFMETGRIYEETGFYTTYRPGFKLYNDFWNEQFRRCQEGYTVGRYTITGDHYFFLNFYRLQSDGKDKSGRVIRTERFPSFMAEQYKWFHYYQLCEYTKKDACALKPRGVGWSEMAASMGLNTYSTRRKSKCIYAAQQEPQLSPTLQRIWDQMEFLNTCTSGGMKHLRMVKNSSMIRRASRRTKDGTELGFKSEIEGVIIDNPRKMRGDRVERLFFEESGSNTLLREAWSQGEALVTIRGQKIGMRVAWGTGGDSGPQLEGLSEMFYDPKSFNILPYKNYYNQKHEECYTSFFIPAYNMLAQAMDNRGVCNSEVARSHYEQERIKRSGNPKAFVIYKSEFCFYPEEALIREGESRFDTEKIAEQITNIELNRLQCKVITGKLQWPLDTNTGHADITKVPQFTPTPDGKIQIIEYPMKDEHNIAYNNLYVAGIDSIDSDQSSSSGQKDVSEFCIVIKRRQLGLKDPQYVAIYKDRPRDVRTAYDNAIKLLMWYNCKAVVEATRVGIITYFKEKNKLNLLFKRPRATMSDVQAKESRQYGAPANERIILHNLELIDNFITDYCHTIFFMPMLQEALKYSYENKRKFDIIAAMGYCELGDEELYGIQPRTSAPAQKQWHDIGYYIDEHGYKRYGVIPQKSQEIEWM